MRMAEVGECGKLSDGQSHNIRQKYHFLWITKYRYKVLRGAIAERARILLAQGCEAHKIKILGGHIGSDHVHIILSCPPSLSPSYIMQILKEKTSHDLQTEFSELKKRYWGQHMWARGYFCATVGAVDDETVRHYIEHHNGFEIPANFTVDGEEPLK